MNDLPRAMIQVQNLSKVYGYRHVLRALSLEVARGQSVALLGSNGSGKTTLLRLICGLATPTSGTIEVGGWSIPQETAQVRQHIGVVSHKSLLYPTLTALENLTFFAQLYSLSQTPADLLALLDRVGLRKRAHSLVKTFSRGMLQRLSIARALVNDPGVLLLDEPYTGLDQAASAVLDTLLQQARSDGRTLLMTTHHLERVPLLTDRVVVLHGGQVALDIPTEISAADLVRRYIEITGEVAQP